MAGPSRKTRFRRKSVSEPHRQTRTPHEGQLQKVGFGNWCGFALFTFRSLLWKKAEACSIRLEVMVRFSCRKQQKIRHQTHGTNRKLICIMKVLNILSVRMRSDGSWAQPLQPSIFWFLVLQREMGEGKKERRFGGGEGGRHTSRHGWFDSEGKLFRFTLLTSWVPESTTDTPVDYTLGTLPSRTCPQETAITGTYSEHKLTHF